MDVRQKVFGITTPDRALFTHYVITSLILGPFFFLILIPLYFRYHTLRYTFDDEGITMRWGLLFRREISLTYARIQDIHLSSNVVERWLDLAKIQVQTASGSSSAEMTIEGIREFEMVRDYLYSRMRGIRGAGPSSSPEDQPDELTAVLREIAAETRALREVLERQS